MSYALMLLSNPYRPDPRVLAEARALKSEGIEVTLIAWDRDQAWPPESDDDGVHVIRLGPKCPQRSARAMIARLPRFWWRALKVSRNLKFDVVHAHDFDTLPLGRRISRRWGKPLLYDAHELYAKMVQNEVGPLWRPIWRLEKRYARRADEVITVSEALAEELAKGRERKPRVVTTSQDPSIVRNGDPQAIRRKYGLSGFVLSYLGSLEPGRFVEETIASFGPEDRVTVVVGGSGTLSSRVAGAAKSNPAVKFIGVVPTDEALRITAASDLVVGMMDPRNPNNVIGTPGKIVNAMAVGRPVITTKGLDIARTVEETESGIVIPWSGEAFVEAVMKARVDPKGLDEMGRKGRAYYDQHFSWNRSKEELLKAYRALIPPS